MHTKPAATRLRPQEHRLTTVEYFNALRKLDVGSVDSLGDFMFDTQKPHHRPTPRPILLGVDGDVQYVLRSGLAFYKIIDDLDENIEVHPRFVEFLPEFDSEFDATEGVLRYGFHLGALEGIVPKRTDISADVNTTAATGIELSTPFNVFLNPLDKSIWIVLDQKSQDGLGFMEFTGDPWDSLPSFSEGRAQFDVMRILSGEEVNNLEGNHMALDSQNPRPFFTQDAMKTAKRVFLEPHTADAGEVMAALNPKELFVAVVGHSGAGKSTFISNLVGNTQEPKTEYKTMKIYDYRYHDNVVHLMDTPTWDNEERTDDEILNDVQQCWKGCALKESTVALGNTAPLDGMIYLHALSFHHAGYAPRALRIFKLLFCEHTFPYLILATTRWEQALGNNHEKMKSKYAAEDFLRGLTAHRGGREIWCANTAESAKSIVTALVENFEAPSIHVPQRIPEYHQHWTVPRAADRPFIGRTKELADMRQALLGDPTIYYGVRRARTFEVAGPSGQGKTEFCLRLAMVMREEYWGVFWVDASNRYTVERDLITIARATGDLVTTIDGARQLLTNLKKPWLLFCDNAGSNSLDRWVSSGDYGSLVIVGVPNSRKNTGDGTFALKGLDQEDAVKLVLQAAQVSEASWTEETDAASAIVKVLDSHTLALLQAGAYVARHHCELATYPKVYQEQRRLLHMFDHKKLGQLHTIYPTLELSAAGLEDLKSTTASDALQLVQTLCMLRQGDIPIAMFQHAWNNAQDLRKNKDRNGESTECKVKDAENEHTLPVDLAELPRHISTYGKNWNYSRLREALILITSQRSIRNTYSKFKYENSKLEYQPGLGDFPGVLPDVLEDLPGFLSTYGEVWDDTQQGKAIHTLITHASINNTYRKFRFRSWDAEDMLSPPDNPLTLLPEFMSVCGNEWDGSRLRGAIKLLTEYALIDNRNTHSISMHGLVRGWARRRQSADEQEHAWICMMLVVVFALLEDNTYSRFLVPWHYRQAR